jgi:hypothetical protein
MAGTATGNLHAAEVREMRNFSSDNQRHVTICSYERLTGKIGEFMGGAEGQNEEAPIRALDPRYTGSMVGYK